MDVNPLPDYIVIRPQIDGVRILGVACGIYITLFVLYFGLEVPWHQIFVSHPYQATALFTGLILVTVGLVLSLRTTSTLGWGLMALTPGFVFDIPAFVTAKAFEIGFLCLALGIPLLVLLETILTIEGATAKARVVFRGRALLKASLILVVILSSLMLVFSNWDILEQYSTSPEAATFHTAIIAGLTTIIFARFLLAEPKYEEDGP